MKDRTQINNSETVEEELVAYLDGELDSESSLHVERRLADDSTYRSQLQRLQRAWDMLDVLPRAQSKESFTRSTVELVAVKSANSAQNTHKTMSARRNVLLGAAAVMVLFAALLGYRIVSLTVSASNRQLVRDLPVIENVDLYYHVDSMQFLRELEESGLFADQVEEIGDET